MAQRYGQVSENALAQHSIKSLTTFRIIDLLKELFSLVLKKQRSGMNTTLAAYNRDANTFAISMPPAIPQTSVKVEEAESYVHAEDNAAQLATRYATIFLNDG